MHPKQKKFRIMAQFNHFSISGSELERKPKVKEDPKVNLGRKSLVTGDRVMETANGRERDPKYQVKVQSLEIMESDTETREVIVKNKEI